MIDTVRFKIPNEYNLVERLKKYSVNTRKYNNITNEVIFNFSTVSFEGSFSRKVNIHITDSNDIFLELSLPKFKYGHNLYLLYPYDISSVLDSLYSVLLENFDTFPNPSNWLLYRLDLCYAWKLQDKHELDVILATLQTLDYSRKKKYRYDTSVMYVGNSYSVKFYDKHSEFFKNDFKFLRDYISPNIAYNSLYISENILRFELTLRSKWIKYNQVDRNILNIPLDFYEETLIKYFNKYTNGLKLTQMTESNAYIALQKQYKKDSKVNTLFSFYLHYISNPKYTRLLYKPSTRYQYLRELKNANISLSPKSLNILPNFSLHIPDDKVVNTRQVL